MKVSFTIDSEILGMAFIPSEFRKQVKELYLKSQFVTLTLEPVKRHGSDEQNRAWHALIREYWISGCSSYESFEDLRDSLKLRIGGAKEYIYFHEGRQRTVKSLDDIPNVPIAVQIPYSWTEFNRDQRKEMIDTTISEMHMAGVNTRKFDEILRGLHGEA